MRIAIITFNAFYASFTYTLHCRNEHLVSIEKYLYFWLICFLECLVCLYLRSFNRQKRKENS